ncbi:hypothetical protein CWR48_06775 [Oceanobacillus arenosus]|uniref:5-bromo-4-chloroindolyl phosphate hydrolysis protein n=1 Tax=Oceanobacillus arenosus TaxID=1229153 RepID=A0A3D8PV56_9BACI|nr:5-bromo-4-chloroindolyl phosphate hydrolysis family protein [Oceanobacillus arenosus]RDW20006.1 hypothetical protein CWR48_06775 [Oceanobacillus arenosus]
MNLIKGVISGAIGAILFILFLFVLDAGTIISIIIGIISFLATLLIFHSLTSKTVEEETQLATSSFYLNILNEGHAKLATIKNEVTNIQKDSIRTQANELLRICDQIFKELEENLQDIQTVRQFFTYYLDALHTILKKYNQISRNELRGNDIEKMEERVAQNLELLHDLFISIRNKLLEDDVIDLDIELQTLQKMLKSEGVSSSE